MPFMMVDSNEGIDRNRIDIDKDGVKTKATKSISNMRVVQRLKKMFPKLQETPLSCGDINIILDNGELLAIERKRAGDFLGSIASGRIFRQVESMSQGAKWSCVIIEGLISFNVDDMAVIPVYAKDDRTITELEVTGWRGVSVRGAMWAIQFNGTPIVMTEPLQLPNVIIDLMNFCMKPTEHTQSLGRKRIVTFPPITLTEEIISAFPGVGTKRARALMKFAQGQNDTDTATLAECLAWGAYLGKLHKKSRPEGWGDMTIMNFRATLGLQEGEYMDFKTEKKETKKNGRR